ncbi:hypothetical protein ACOMHN_028639 [Nucella lapillus]
MAQCIWRNLSLNYSRAASRFCLVFQRRHRYKKKWAVNTPSKAPTELALQHFDAFYRPVFGNQWPSIRVALLSTPKYAAIINNASESHASVQQLMELGAVDLIQEAVNIVHKTGGSREKYTASIKQNRSIFADSKNDSAGQISINTAEISLEGEGNRIHSSEDKSVFKESPEVSKTGPTLPVFRTKQCESREERDRKRKEQPVDSMPNLLAPDAVRASSDLEYFMPTEQVFSEKEELRLQEYAQSVYNERAVTVPVIPGHFLSLPKSLTVMAFPPRDVSDFPRPLADASHLLNYYLLDASSVLPVVALDLQPGDQVLDLCAAPGGKTLALLQILTALGGHVDSNDVSQSRVRRLRTVLRSYLPERLQEECVTVTEHNGRSFRDPVYNKVLVDVPCSSDRHVLLEEENSLFKPSRLKERLNMTTLQKDLLLAGVKACRPGGSVVYSTCSLAAAQNDGVVQAALEELWETTHIDVALQDLAPLTTIFSPFFHFHPSSRLGLLVVPSLLNNYGPAYCCKLRRLN